jgi:hypothetical protein
MELVFCCNRHNYSGLEEIGRPRPPPAIVLTLIPVFDGLVVLRHAGWAFTPVILIHWGTAALMLVIMLLMRRGK